MKIIYEKHEIKFLSFLLAFISISSALAYVIYKFFSNRYYNEKWKYYDDCGLA